MIFLSEFGMESDSVSVGESPRITSNLKIDNFLDETYKTSLRLSDYFSDTDKFIRSVNILKQVVDYDLLDEKKQLRLKKRITTLHR